VVAQERDQSTSLCEADQHVNYPAAVRPSVDVVTQGNDGVVPTGRNGIDYSRQGVWAAVDVADRNETARHPVALQRLPRRQ
jgi:hypothetical protein